MIETNEYKKSVNDLLTMSKDLDGLYDILLRGTINNEIVPGWSDIDLTIVLEKINSKTLSQVRQIYLKLKKIYSFKISITIVSINDIKNTFHHHGIKPILYNQQLCSAKSLFNKEYNFKKIPEDINKIDILAHLSYLIHNLRLEYRKCDDSLEAKSGFCIHLIKRAKHVIRHSIQLYNQSVIDEEINMELYNKHFSHISKDFPDRIAYFKRNWKDISNEMTLIDANISETFNVIEGIYEKVLEDFNENQKS